MGIIIKGFDRNFLKTTETYMTIGPGEVGGKAHGLIQVNRSLSTRFDTRPEAKFQVTIPRFAVITTPFFDAFMELNDLFDIACSDSTDERIAHHFRKADLPPNLVGDLRGLIEKTVTPLAIRSSSLLEDAMFEPFAGIYGTKMIPNNQPDADTRFQRLTEAVKFVYASTFFKQAKDYFIATGHDIREEKMAVIIQEVIGNRYGDRFYPSVSGVGRSYNFYPAGRSRPEDGVVDLALGLGKTIVGGGLVWTYSPVHPKAKPPVSSVRELLKKTQTRFWAVNMGKPPGYDPMKETEYLVQAGLEDAEYDGTLNLIASTFDPQSDRLTTGLTGSGPKVIDFSPILELELIPLNDILKQLLPFCEEMVGAEVEIEFAMSLGKSYRDPVRFGLLQARPMVVGSEVVEVADDELSAPDTIISSARTLGNGTQQTIRDIVYVRPASFDPKHTPAITLEIEKINRRLHRERIPYLLIGFGRWGSSDPWLGIPAEWGQICGAKAIIEATLENMQVELSQGSHFFHNLSSFQIAYFTVSHTGADRIDWDWISRQRVVESLDFVDHVTIPSPLTIKVDGRTGKGVIRYESQP